MKREELRLQAQLEDTHFWYAGRRRQVRARLPRASRTDAWALDLGAGSGGNSGLLGAAGYHVVALERDPVAAAFTRDRGVAVLRGDAHALPFADGALDLVLACDVLEHLPDDTRAAKEVRRVLRPGGTFVATVPADPALWSSHDVALSHVRRYTAPALRDVLESASLQVRSLDSWMVLLRPAVRLRRALSKQEEAVADDTASDLEPVGRLLNGLLSATLRVEERVPALRRRRGVSLVAVAVKA